MTIWARAGTAGLLMAAGLAACRNPPEPVRPAAPASQGPVNPDVSLTTYACLDGQTVTVGYPDTRTAVVTYRSHAYTLTLAQAASGARYTGYGLQWWVKGDHAEIAALAPGEEMAGAAGITCMARREKPAAGPATRILFAPGRTAWARRI